MNSLACPQIFSCMYGGESAAFGFICILFVLEFEGHGVCIVLTPCFGVMDVSDVLRDICSARAPDAMGG